jgi:hypothetical protein
MEQWIGDIKAKWRTRMDGKNTESELAAVLEQVPQEKRMRLLASAQALRFAADVVRTEREEE